jgi:hypothetical protein
MVPTQEAALAVALDRVRWALAYPRRHAQDDWDGRLRRALAALRSAWDEHIAHVEALLALVADPAELPFTPVARQARAIRQEHRKLAGEAHQLLKELEAVPSVYQSGFNTAGSGPSGKRLATIVRRAEALAAGVRRHLAAEASLSLADPEVPRFPTDPCQPS